MIGLRGITWAHPRGFDSVVGATAAYRATAPDIEIHWEARSLQAFADQPLDELCRRFDLLVIDHPHVAHAGRSGLLAPLGPGFDLELAALAAASVGASHDSYRIDGRQFALVIDAAAQVSVWRPDLLADPPTDWEGVLDLARDGRLLWPLKPIDAYSSLLTLVAAAGQPAFAEPGSFLGDDVGMEVLDLMSGLSAHIPRECFTQDPIDIAERLARDDRWLYAPLAFGYTNYSRAGFRTHRLRYGDMPGGTPWRGSLLGGAGIAVSAATPHRDAATAYAFWLASDSVQRGAYFAAGGQPGNAEAWDDPALDAATMGFFSGTRRTLEGAWVRPHHPRYLRFQDQVSPWVTSVLTGELQAAAFLAESNRLATDLFARDA